MSFQVNFGRLTPPANTATAPRATGVFRIAMLGDFSGRAHRGKWRGSTELAACKPIRLDVDTLDAVIAGFGTVLHLPVGAGGAIVELRPRSLDDLHPDALVEQLPLFAELMALRQRLAHPKTFAAAAAQIRAWRSETTPADMAAPERRRPRDELAIDAKLSDFARLLGQEPVPARTPTAVDELMRCVVAPHVVEKNSADATALTATVDRALAAAMNSLLHDPDFQSLEAAWRSLDFVTRRVATSATVQIVGYDISAEELAADLSSVQDLRDSAVYRLLVEQPALDAHQGPLSALIGLYGFDLTPPHAELLGRIAAIAAEARAPFIAAVSRDCITTRSEDLHPLVIDAWKALRALPAARYVALTVPRFMLRLPYGERSEPIDSFEFEEFDQRTGLKTLLWGNPSVLAAVLLGRHAVRAGTKQAPGALLGLDEMPCFTYTDDDGDCVALPSTERLLAERATAHVHAQGFVPVIARRGAPQVQLGGFRSLAGTPLAGPWSPIEARPQVPESQPAAVAVAMPADVAEASGSEYEVVTVSADAKAEAERELDALLAQLKETAAPAPAAESSEAIDPDLAALLNDL